MEHVIEANRILDHLALCVLCYSESPGFRLRYDPRQDFIDSVHCVTCRSVTKWMRLPRCLMKRYPNVSRAWANRVPVTSRGSFTQR